MSNLTFDQKIGMLALAKSPKEKKELINKFANNKEFFVGVNAKQLPLEQYMELKKEKFASAAIKAKLIRDNIKNKGWTDKKYQKYMAELPEDLFLERPEFSAYLPQKQLGKNVKRFLELYPQFRVDK